jgi:hypothetical protein
MLSIRFEPRKRCTRTTGSIEFVRPRVDDRVLMRRSIAAMMRSLSSCLDVTRMWRRTDRVSLEKKPSTRLSHEPCLGAKLNSKRPAG